MILKDRRRRRERLPVATALGRCGVLWVGVGIGVLTHGIFLGVELGKKVVCGSGVVVGMGGLSAAAIPMPWWQRVDTARGQSLQ